MTARSPSPLREHTVDPEWSEDRHAVGVPEHRLLMAIVRRAVWDFVLYKDVKAKEDPLLHEVGVDASEWLHWDGKEPFGEDGSYSFLYICDVLDLDAARVRRIAARLTREDISRLNNNIKER